MSGEPVFPRVPPVVLLAGAAAVQLDLTPGRPSTRASRLAGAAFAACSAAVALASISAFARRGTTIDPVHADRASQLVVSGINARSRNPMYVGMAGVLVAIAVTRRSWLALLPAAGFVAAIDRWQIRAEEAALEARFGDAYRAYRRRVPRWIGRRSIAGGRGSASL